MSTPQSRIPSIILPDDGGGGGDDDVDTTLHVSTPHDILANLIGAPHVANKAALPVSDLFTGRLALTEDTGAIWRYVVGTGWVLLYAKPFAISALTGTNVPNNTYYGVGNVWSGVTSNTYGGTTIFETGVDTITWRQPGLVSVDILYYIPAGAADKMGDISFPGLPSNVQTANFRGFDRASVHASRVVAANDAWVFHQNQNSGATVNGCTFNLYGTFQPFNY